MAQGPCRANHFMAPISECPEGMGDHLTLYNLKRVLEQPHPAPGENEKTPCLALDLGK